MGFKHGIMVSLILLFGVAVSAVAAEPGMTVEARQRYPWNGLVDLKFTITGESGTKYDTSFTAKDMVGGTNIAMKTIRKSNGVAVEEKEKLLPGTYNWIWDAAADLPKDFKCERMTVIGESKKEYDKVQLWEGGPYWATMNIGAKKPSDVGYYFWWGDVIGYKFVNNTVVTSDGSPSDIIFKGSGGNVPTNTHEVKNLVRDGWLSDDYILVPKCDAAHVHMGIGWRMPTPQEFVDLNSKCEWIWSRVDGVDGYLVRGKGNYSSASIFLPVTGCIYGSSVESITYGMYWSSRAYDGYSSWSFCSYRLSFTYGNHSFAIGEYYALSDRYMGYPIRPVFDR